MQETQPGGITKRVWPALPEEVYDDLWDFAKEERRTASEMAAIFIENAIKERKRQRNKKKNGKEDQV
jgi:hypothetical protein